jgi:hypothetical protein
MICFFTALNGSFSPQKHTADYLWIMDDALKLVEANSHLVETFLMRAYENDPEFASDEPKFCVI